MKKTDWFNNARFGLFIHWGIYSIPARGEWTYANDQWAEGEYEKFMHEFNPVDYNPTQWAKMAKAAGMKYVVFTTRHHDGFCMFDSHYCDYKITNTPYGKDVTKMLVEAFRAEGMRVGFYYSLPDWTHYGWSDQESPIYFREKKLPEISEEAHQEYLDLIHNHLNQLTTEYGKIDILFVDYTSQYKANEDYYDRERMLKTVYANQPEIIVNDRFSYYKDNVRDFDYYTPEICVPNEPLMVKGKPVSWESCLTLNDNWGYCENDHEYKTVEALTTGIMGCISRGGNALLNVGPDQLGKFPDKSVEKLQELAEWQKYNNEAICGTASSKYTPPFGGCYTQKENVLYLYFMQPPAGDVILAELKGLIEKITLLRTGKNIPLINDWGFELLKKDEQRIRPRHLKAGDVLKIELKISQ